MRSLFFAIVFLFVTPSLIASNARVYKFEPIVLKVKTFDYPATSPAILVNQKFVFRNSLKKNFNLMDQKDAVNAAESVPKKYQGIKKPP